MTKFNVGDEVTLTTRPGVRATVEYGPFDGRDVYVVKLVEPPADPDDAQTFTALASVMKPAPKFSVGDKVKGVYTGIVYTIEAGPFDDDGYEWCATREPDGSVSYNGVDSLRAVEPEPDTYIYGGVTYDLSAKYEDRDGDHWTFDTGTRGADGTPNGKLYGYAGGGYSYTLGYAHGNYGPLIRVTD